MSDREDLLLLAGAIADGTPIDWPEVESSASSDDTAILKQLRLLAGVASVHKPDPFDASEPSIDTAAKSALKSWGPFELRREIGKGSFGTVYLAWDRRLQRSVALKILHESHRHEAILEEARLLARVGSGENVVKIFTIEEFERSLGLQMEFINGLTLKELLIERRAPYSALEAASIGVALCGGVAAVHKAGLLHRDIKTQNVMRETGGRIVLMDFGGGERYTDQTRDTRRTTGTPLYLAPEVLEGEPASVASDIYAIGVLLYHLVTLRYPVEGESVDDLRDAHARGQITALAERSSNVPAGFVRVVERALERDSARRYHSADAMRKDLFALVEPASGPVAPTAAERLRRDSATKSVGVLPFTNIGPDKDLDYFCRGLAEELLIALGKVKGLRVASRASSLRYGQIITDIRNVCEQLDVDYVVEGTVSKEGNVLVIHAGLVGASDGCYEWSERFPGTMSDVFATQERIAKGVVTKLIERADTRTERLTRRHTSSPRGYQLYLKGRYYWARRYQGGLGRALDYFNEAIREDGEYALAYAGLADGYVFRAFYSLQKPREAFELAWRAATHALADDPSLPEAHTSLALIKLGRDWDWAEADRAFNRSLELDPAQPLTEVYHSWLAALKNDPPAAAARAKSALEIEPLWPLVHAGVAYTHFLLREYDKGIAACQECLQLDPSFIAGIYIMGMCRAQAGELAAAVDLMQRAVTLSNRAPFYLGLLGNFLGRDGRVGQAQQLIQELEHAREGTYVPPHAFAYIYAGLDDFERAFEWQHRARADGASPFNYFSPVVDNLRHDPRHHAQMREMGLRD